MGAAHMSHFVERRQPFGWIVLVFSSLWGSVYVAYSFCVGTEFSFTK